MWILSVDFLQCAGANESSQAEYASVPFFILTLALVKWSISDFITQLTPSDHHLHVDMGLRILVGAWLVAGVIASLFQCSMPAPWDYVNGSRCIDRVGCGPPST